jgi:hypothetical protein
VQLLRIANERPLVKLPLLADPNRFKTKLIARDVNINDATANRKPVEPVTLTLHYRARQPPA